MKFLIFIVFQVFCRAQGANENRRKNFSQRRSHKKDFPMKETTVKTRNKRLAFSVFALNKQYPYNKRWQKVCFILISVRHEAQKTGSFSVFSSVNCWKVLHLLIVEVTRTYLQPHSRHKRIKALNFHITYLIHNGRNLWRDVAVWSLIEMLEKHKFPWSYIKYLHK